MVTQSITTNEFQETLGTQRKTLNISLPHAKVMLERGLNYFVGDKAQWLQGYDDIVTWLQDNKGKGLLLYGANGRGKSLMARQILPTLFNYYYKSEKTYVCRGVELRLLLNRSNEYYEMASSRIFCIDDFGTEDVVRDYGEKHDVFSDLVDLAEIDKRLLVLSTNLSPDEICKRYGLRTLDRLKALTTVICFEGESLRGK